MKTANTEDNMKKCICSRCPLYNDCNKENSEGLYCARTKTECPMDNTKACICGACVVFAENDLTEGYFCLNEISE